MVNVIIHVSKYILAILAASYAMKCFTVFSDRHEYDRGHVYVVQNVLMFLIHFICYLIIYLMTKDEDAVFLRRSIRVVSYNTDHLWDGL